MNPRSSASISLVARIVMMALLLSTASGSSLLRAAPSAPPQRPAPAPILGRGTLSLEATSSSLPATGTMDWTARVRLTQRVDSLQVRLQVYRPSGRLLYQRTQYASDVPTGTASFRWERDLEDLDLRPDTYPVFVSVHAEQSGKRPREATVNRQLRIYEPTKEKTPVAFVVRIEGVPLSDPQGRFTVNPGTETETRDDTRDLCRAVLRSNRIRVSVSIAPALLEEWRRISRGYEQAGPAGVTKVPASAPVPREYAQTLDVLREAIASGRLELLSAGYGDPDPCALRDAGLLGDLGAQLDVGHSAIFSSLELTPSAGYAPPEGHIPPQSPQLIADKKMEFVVVSQSTLMSGDETASTGVARIQGHDLRALITDDVASHGLASAEASAVVDRAFERQTSDLPRRPVIVSARLGAGRSLSAARLATIVRSVDRQPWTRVMTASNAVSRPNSPVVSIPDVRSDDDAPSGYWPETALARGWARALGSAVGRNDAEADAANLDSLIAESASWAGPDRKWSLADRGRAFGNQAQRISEGVLGKVSVRAENVTLAGSRGKIPVSIRNDSGRTLKVTLRVNGTGLSVDSPSRKVKLRPSENFITLPVDLRSSLQGDLAIQVLAPPRLLADEQVSVRASYLDRLAIIGAVVMVLFMLLLFIVRRVRAAEAESDAEQGERYTDAAAERTADDFSSDG